METVNMKTTAFDMSFENKPFPLTTKLIKVTGKEKIAKLLKKHSNYKKLKNLQYYEIAYFEKLVHFEKGTKCE